MRRPITTATTILVVVLALGEHAVAHRGTRGRAPAYDPKTVETVTGTVESAERVPIPRGRGRSLHLTVKTDRETLPVHVGPAWYVDREDVKIERGDRLEIKGSRVTLAGTPVLIASELKKGSQVLRMRDDDGAPRWTRRGRR